MPNSLSRRGTAMLAIGLAASLGVAACGSSKKSGGSAGGGKNYKMTLIAGVKGDEFYITMNCGAQAEASKLGVSLNFQGPDQFDASLQTPIVVMSRVNAGRMACSATLPMKAVLNFGVSAKL